MRNTKCKKQKKKKKIAKYNIIKGFLMPITIINWVQ